MDVFITQDSPRYPLPQRAELPDLPEPFYWGDNLALSARIFDKRNASWRVVVAYHYPAFIERFMSGRWVDGRRWSDMPRCLIRYWAGMDGCKRLQMPFYLSDQTFLRRAWRGGMLVQRGEPARLFVSYIQEGFCRAEQRGEIVRVDEG